MPKTAVAYEPIVSGPFPLPAGCLTPADGALFAEIVNGAYQAAVEAHGTNHDAAARQFFKAGVTAGVKLMLAAMNQVRR